MLDLSRKILGEGLKACKASKMKIVRVKLAELNDLVALFGEQMLLLKQTCLRLKGWDKKEEVYKDLLKQLVAMPAPEFVDVLRFGTLGA